MTTIDSLTYRNCGWCGVRDVAMTLKWLEHVQTAVLSRRTWAAVACPRCGGCSLLELDVIQDANGLSPRTRVTTYSVIPEDGAQSAKIAHLPPDIEEHYVAALRVLDAGVPDAAAVQLRRTLEGAASKVGVTGGTLVQQIGKLVEAGAVTKEFGRAVHHVRKIGNLGAHFTDDRLNEAEVRRAMRFTEQLLRNLFEVPGELAEIEAASAVAARAAEQAATRA